VATKKLCDWNDRHELTDDNAHRVKFDNEPELDICTSCLKAIRPKARVGRPRKAKVQEQAAAN